MNKIIALFLILTSVISSQELNCKVTVNYEQVRVANRERLVDFANVVQNYLNTARYTNEDYAMKIDCAMSIFFLSAAGDFDYSAQIVVTSQRSVYRSDRKSPMLKINDGQWQFRYEPGKAMYANQTTFDPLTSFLDFYALIIIGMDRDTFLGPFGGTKVFLRAMDIANLGATSSKNTGWLPSSSVYNRNGLISDILTNKYSEFRGSIFDYHQYGVDQYNSNKNEALQYIINPINILWDLYKKSGSIKSVYVRTFFNAKNGEIADLLKFYPDPEIFTKLKKIDPPHSAKYDAIAP
jgi:hypothetical protein